MCFHVLPLATADDDTREGNRRPPNIVFVLTDDQAAWAVGSASDRFPEVQRAATPNMDRLASEGTTLANCFCVTPVCSPARAAIMTGRYASEFGIEDFIPHPTHKLFDPEHQSVLDPDTSVTFAEVLQDHGYRTGLVGKWHLGDWVWSQDQQQHPTNHGFETFMGLTSGGTTPSNPELEKDGIVKIFEGLTTDILADHAIEFLETTTIDERPFLLCLHTRAPHGRWLPVAPQDWRPYAKIDATIPSYPDLNTEKVRRDMREYLASTTGVDRNLGRMMDALDRLRLTDNTILIFTSDHGYNMGHNGIVHKGNGIWATRTKPPGAVHHGTRVISPKYRPNMYDLSLRVPAMIRWPGAVEPGSTIANTATHLDLFPTLLEMAGIDPPSEWILRGRSLVPLLKGQNPEGWSEDLYAEYSMINYVVANMRCYRTPRYKLIRDFHNHGRDEFYDLENDPEESNNLIHDDDPEVRQMIAELQGKLSSKMKALGDPASKHPRSKVMK